MIRLTVAALLTLPERNGPLRSTPSCEVRSIMVWFFERSDEQIEVETRFDNATLEYVVIVRRPNQEQVTRFSDAEGLRARLVDLTQQLEADDWLTSGPPVILPDGWPDKQPPR